MGKLLFLLFAALPIAEIALLVEVGRRIGAGPTLALVLVPSLLGATLARREGLRVLRDSQASLAEGRVPGEGLLGAALVFLGGVLLVVPGLISDAAGLLLLFPPTRRVVARWLSKRLERGLKSGSVHASGFGFGGRPSGPRVPGTQRHDGPARPRARRPAHQDISDAEIVDDD